MHDHFLIVPNLNCISDGDKDDKKKDDTTSNPKGGRKRSAEVMSDAIRYAADKTEAGTNR